MSEVKYGKYIGAINQSKEDSAAGQTGKTYTLTKTVGVTKAKDLISGKTYQDANGIKVDVAPQSAVLLEILETTDTVNVGAVYEYNGSVLGSEVKTVLKGETVTFDAPVLDGYSLKSGEDQAKTVTADEDTNVVFSYETNEAPKFTADYRDVKDAGWRVLNYGEANGMLTDEGDGKYAISSVCPSGEENLMKTFVYKEVAGDFEIHVKLTGFDATSYDTDYFGVLATDSLDLFNANFVEERHFSNNNNILMVTHSEGQEKSTTSFWAGDMNNKSVPIHYIIKRTGNQIEYWYSLDDGETYEQTSKPRVPLTAKDTMYVGFCMTAQKEIENTAHIEDATITGEMVGEAIQKGDTITLDFSTSDKENDDTEFKFITELPEGAKRDGQKVIFTPVREGEYVFTATVKDMYHEQPTTKTIKVNVAPIIKLTLDGNYIYSDVSPYISNDRTMVPIRVISESLGAEVDWNGDTREVTVNKDGNTVKLTIDSANATVNGVAAELDAPAVIKESRTFVPIRFISENLGWKVDWDGESYTVLISE